MLLQVEAEEAAAERPVEAPPPVLTYDAFRHLCLAHPLQVGAPHPQPDNRIVAETFAWLAAAGMLKQRPCETLVQLSLYGWLRGCRGRMRLWSATSRRCRRTRRRSLAPCSASTRSSWRCRSPTKCCKGASTPRL